MQASFLEERRSAKCRAAKKPSSSFLYVYHRMQFNKRNANTPYSTGVVSCANTRLEKASLTAILPARSKGIWITDWTWVRNMLWWKKLHCSGMYKEKCHAYGTWINFTVWDSVGKAPVKSVRLRKRLDQFGRNWTKATGMIGDLKDVPLL